MNMEKHKIIGFIAIIIIIGTVGSSLLNVYALEQLEFGGIDNLFRFFHYMLLIVKSISVTIL